MARLRNLCLAALAVLAVGAPAAPAAADETSVQAAASSWRSDGPGVYVAPAARDHPLSGGDVRRIHDAVVASDPPIYVAALGEPHHQQAVADLREVIDRTHLS